MDQLPLPGLATKPIQINQIYNTPDFGLCKVVDILWFETPSPAYECVPLEFDHPLGTVFVVADDLREHIEL